MYRQKVIWVDPLLGAATSAIIPEEPKCKSYLTLKNEKGETKKYLMSDTIAEAIDKYLRGDASYLSIEMLDNDD